MLDQDTARALLVIADEHQARLALVGDRHQLPAVGRGGVLDLAVRWADPAACLALESVHRFADPDYAQLSLAMRTGEHPDQVFDTLLARDQIRIHPSETERTQALDDIAASQRRGEVRGEPRGEPGRGRDPGLVIADTREQVAAINAAVRDQLVAAGRVAEAGAMTTLAGERIGVGDLVATRRNDRDLDVANRDTWTLAAIAPDGAITVAGVRGDRRLPAAYAREHLELAYATTAYGAQGQTVETAHLVLGEHTGAAAAYVGMTRGRTGNVAHLVAQSIEDVRRQWIGTFGRDRADLGPAHAARLAAEEAATYAPHRPLERALADLHQAWTHQAYLTDRLAHTTHHRDQLAPIAAIRTETEPERTRLENTETHAWRAAEEARGRFDRVQAVVEADTARFADALRRQWDNAYPQASRAAEVIRHGAGRLGGRRAQVRDSRTHLAQWAQAWRPVLPELPTDPDQLASEMPYSATTRLHQAISRYAEDAAHHAHPDHQALRDAAEAAARHADDALNARLAAQDVVHQRLVGLRLGGLAYTRDPAGRLDETERDIAELTAQLGHAYHRVAALRIEPAIRALPPERLKAERDTWRHDREQQKARAKAAWAALNAPPDLSSGARHHLLHHANLDASGPDHGISR